MMVVQLVLARMTLGIIEASATLMPSRPWMLRCWSTTAIGSLAGPILQVPEAWVVLNTVRRIQASRASSDDRSSSEGWTTLSTMEAKASLSSSFMLIRTASRRRSTSRSSSR